MKITVWGNDLPAWTSAAALAESGNDVCLTTDLTDDNHVFNPGNEPGLHKLIQDGLASKRLFTGGTTAGTKHGNVHFLAIGPQNLKLAQSLVEKLGKAHSHDLLIINQSNFGVGTTDKLQLTLDAKKNQVIVYIPDMLSEGSALKNFKSPATLIVGNDNTWALDRLKTVMRPFSHNLKKIISMTRKEAEFTKFANTGMLALRLGYINELANLADQLNVDIEVIREGMGSDPRIGPHYLNPGCGFGGLHFQQYIAAFANLLETNRNSKLLDTVLTENEKQKELPFRKLWQHYNCQLAGKTIALWGLSFKSGTASIDNAPSLNIIASLLAQGCSIKAHDPQANKNIADYFNNRPELSLHTDSYNAAQDADALILLTEWPEYHSVDFERLAQTMRQPLIIDGRNIYDKNYLQSLSFTYYGIGR